MEDLQRDCYGLKKEDPASFFERRMKQMHVAKVEEGEGWICATIGYRPADRLMAAWPVDADTIASVAALISVAKAWDGINPEPGLELCMAKIQPPKPIRTVRLGPLAPGALDQGPPIRSGTYDPNRRLEELDYEDLRRKAVALWKLVQPVEPGTAG